MFDTLDTMEGMVNPYQSTSASTIEAVRHSVRGYHVSGVLLATIGFVFALPGLFLLNQWLGIIPLAFELN